VATEVDLIKDARDQLNLILSFFPRVDAKLSIILAVNTAILATMSAAVPSLHQITAVAVAAGILTAILLALSFYNLYRAGFPNTKGGHSSVIYFRNIAARNEAKFLADYTACTPKALRADLLAQVWRNSEILTGKYVHLKQAFVFMSCALLPWAVALVSFSVAKRGLHMVLN